MIGGVRLTIQNESYVRKFVTLATDESKTTEGRSVNGTHVYPRVLHNLPTSSL